MSRVPRFARVTKVAGYALFCVALIVTAAGAARCYPKDTRVVVFVQGIYTTYDADGTQGTALEPHRFDTIKAAFVRAGYAPDDLLDFSYDGGTVAGDGKWRPSSYPCEATDRPAATNVATLEKMLRDYRAKHPKAHFALVGHSLGGYVAFLAGARDATRPKGQRLEIDSVVTLDAPLLGASADKKTILDFVPCEKTYQAGGELVAQDADPNIADIRLFQAVTMQGDGVRLATLGNLNDCLWATARCIGGTWIDDSATQVLPAAAMPIMYDDIHADLLVSHDAILVHPAAVQQLVDFVGPR